MSYYVDSIRGDALAAFIANYTKLMDLWDWSFQATSDTEMKVRLQGVKAGLSTSQFLLSCSLGKIILKQADHLIKTLQNPSISAAQRKEIAHLVTKTL